MEAAALLFAFGTLWFWILVAVATVVVFAFTEYEKGWGAFLTLAATIVALHIWGELNIFKWVTANPLMVGLYVVGYFAAGAFWGVSKWWFYVKDQREKYDEAFAAFKKVFGSKHYMYQAPVKYKTPSGEVLSQSDFNAARRDHEMAAELGLQKKRANDVEQIPPTLKEEWAEIVKHGHFTHNYEIYNFEYKPRPNKHKARILTWMTYWPFSFIWTMLNDPIKRLMKAIYYKIAGFLTRISDRIFAGAEEVELEK